MLCAYNALAYLTNTQKGILKMAKPNTPVTANTGTTVSTAIKMANYTAGKTYTLPANGAACGNSINKYIQQYAAGSMANVVVAPTPYFTALGITAANWPTQAKLAGMFAANTGIRAHQLKCGTCGVHTGSIVTNKSKAIKKATLCNVGGAGASFNLAHIANAIKATGGKITTGNITTGNTLAMLLTGTNSLTKRHAFYGNPLITLTVKPLLKTK